MDSNSSFLSKIPKENIKAETFILMTLIISVIVFVGLFFYWLSTNYNYDSDGNVIKDSTYNNAKTIQTVYLVFLGIAVVFGVIFYFY